jgi:hypothetical protein
MTPRILGAKSFTTVLTHMAVYLGVTTLSEKTNYKKEKNSFLAV